MTGATRGDRTRSAILAAAKEHLATHRLEGLRGRDVALDAGVSEATVWFHFGTKAGLLVAVMEAYYDALVEDVRETVAAASDPRTRLEAFARFWLGRLERDLALLGELGRHGRFGPDPEVVAAFAACNRRVTRAFERLVEDLAAAGAVRGDVPVHLVRDAFFGTAEHVVVGRAVTGRERDLTAAADDLLGLLLDGLVDRGVEPDLPDGATLRAIDGKLDRVLAQLGSDPAADTPG